MLRTCFITLTLAAIGITPALAQGPYDFTGPNFYLGASVGQSWIKNEIDGYHTNNFGFDVTAGVRALPWLGGEISYIDMGDSHDYYGNCFYGCDGDHHVRSQGGAAFGVFYLPIPRSIAELYGKVGVARLQDRQSGFPYYCNTQCNYLVNEETNTGFAWGGGLQVHWWNFAFRAEYQQFQNQLGRPGLLTAGAFWNF